MGFCNTCQRTVYLGTGDADVCPVCSTPLLTVAANDVVDDPAGARIAENEALFREVNERIKDVAEDYGIQEENEFVCECGDSTCTERLRMSMLEYETIRSNPLHFVIVPGHETPGAEVVVASGEHFATVEKIGPPRRIARDRDPRAAERAGSLGESG